MTLGIFMGSETYQNKSEPLGDIIENLDCLIKNYEKFYFPDIYSDIHYLYEQFNFVENSNTIYACMVLIANCIHSLDETSSLIERTFESVKKVLENQF
jgi:hypothetical protein